MRDSLRLFGPPFIGVFVRVFLESFCRVYGYLFRFKGLGCLVGLGRFCLGAFRFFWGLAFVFLGGLVLEGHKFYRAALNPQP